MYIVLPSIIVASMPTQYVQCLYDTNIASIETVVGIQENSLHVVVDGSHFQWQYGDKRLCVALTALEKASLSVGSFGPKDFVFLTLHFGDPNGGGVRMLHAPKANADSFREIVAALKPLLPCPFEDQTDRHR